MKAEGWKFPAVREAEAMFEADTAPEWAEGEVCHRCRVAFGMMTRQVLLMHFYCPRNLANF